MHFYKSHCWTFSYVVLFGFSGFRQTLVRSHAEQACPGPAMQGLFGQLPSSARVSLGERSMSSWWEEPWGSFCKCASDGVSFSVSPEKAFSDCWLRHACSGSGCAACLIWAAGRTRPRDPSPQHGPRAHAPHTGCLGHRPRPDGGPVLKPGPFLISPKSKILFSFFSQKIFKISPKNYRKFRKIPNDFRFNKSWSTHIF